MSVVLTLSNEIYFSVETYHYKSPQLVKMKKKTNHGVQGDNKHIYNRTPKPEAQRAFQKKGWKD